MDIVKQAMLATHTLTATTPRPLATKRPNPVNTVNLAISVWPPVVLGRGRTLPMSTMTPKAPNRPHRHTTFAQILDAV